MNIRTLLVTLVAFGVAAAPASATEVPHVTFGSEITLLVAAPEGGAWVRVVRDGRRNAVGRASADGRFRTTAVGEMLDGVAIGPDGAAWFGGLRRTVFRAGDDGTVTTGAALPASTPILDNVFATAPDGRLWATTVSPTTFAQITPAGAVTVTTEAVPACERDPKFVALERAADGALWLADVLCHRLLRRSPAGAWTQIVLPDQDPEGLAADATGGVWYIASDIVGHVDAAGAVAPLVLPDDFAEPVDVSVAPDGSAWFATGSCSLLRAAPGGPLERLAAPVPADLVAFAPDGTLWAASRTRLVHTPLAALDGSTCDTRSPPIRYDDRATTTLARLRRGLPISVREPARITVSANYGKRYDTFTTDVRSASGGARRYRLPASWLRSLAREVAAGRRPLLEIEYTATDSDGNTTDSLPRASRVTR